MERADRSLDPVESNETGAVRLRLIPPQDPTPRAEPLVVTGKPGAATLAYLRVLADHRIVVGVEFWGWGTLESDPVETGTANGSAIEIVIAVPSFFPPTDDERWGSMSANERQSRRSNVEIRINDKVVLNAASPVPPHSQLEVAYGDNVLGGSFVAARFTGRILETGRVPLYGPPQR